MKNIFLVLLVVLVVGAGAYVYKMKSKGPSMEEKTETSAEKVVEKDTTGATGAVTDKSAAKEFAVSGNEFAFQPSTLTVKAGDTVKVTFTNTGKYPHNFVIDALNVKSKTVKTGESDTVTFTADKAGSFEYYCAVPTHKDKGMVGTLTVQ